MSTFLCPNCGWQHLTPMKERDRFTCLKCMHIFHIVDVLVQAYAEANNESLIMCEDIPELDFVQDLLDKGELKGGI